MNYNLNYCSMTAKLNNIVLSLLISVSAVTSRLVVYGPPELKSKFEYNGNLIVNNNHLDFKINANFANFGNIPYG